MAFTLDRSRALYDRARETLVEGVSSPSRGAVNYDVPIFMASGAGGRITDADGNEYVDLMMAYGALLHGHAHPRLVAAGERALRQGTLFATASEIEAEVAERISALVPGAERVRFANTGTEATMAAIRIARALTGRPMVVKFEGHYHGWYDAFLVSSHPRDPARSAIRPTRRACSTPQGLTDGSVADTVVCAWNDAALLADCLARHAGRVAAVITEPVMANMGVIPPRPGYLDEMRRLCDEHGALLIVDETVTGFRLHPGRMPGALRRHRRPGHVREGAGRGPPARRDHRPGRRHGRPRRRPRAALRHPERAQPRPLGDGREPRHADRGRTARPGTR